MDYLRLGIVLGLAGSLLEAQGLDTYALLEKAYEALRAKDYGAAIASFEQVLAAAPDRADVRKDLAYTLLKTGENLAARDHFEKALALDPADDRVALEYAFLCYETREPIRARRAFDRLRREARAPEDRATAEQAFENIDRPLREGIARWREALASAATFSGHEELARLAEQRDEMGLAAEHYEKAWRLRPDRRGLLLDLGRVWKELERAEDSMAALLAASRGAEPRVAEEARERLPARYPYVYEFERGLELDPANIELRRELAYLLLEMNDVAAAERHFELVLARAPDDLLSLAQLGFLRTKRGDQTGAELLAKVLTWDDAELADRVRVALKLPPVLRTRAAEPDPASGEASKRLAESSLEKGYLKDALKYLTRAHEDDPVDFGVMLKLGWTYNILKQDREAVRWFNLARRSPDPAVASEASRAYRNLAPGLSRVRTTLWMFPMFSTRWHDTFTYAQAKAEMFPPSWVLRPYLSVRFVGDTRGQVDAGGGLGPQYLSERSAILGVGLATRTWHGVSGWFEAGEAFRYRQLPGDAGRIVPDFRGGVAHAHGFGRMLGQGRGGWFAETNNDAVFVSRFGNNSLLYTQNRTGYTLPAAESGLGFQAQFYWNWNATGDVQRQSWANFAETGPGVRFRFSGMPSSLLFSVNAVRGAYLVDQGGVRRPNYSDVRVALWYAFSH